MFTRVLIVILIVLVLGIGSAAYYFYSRYTSLKENPEQLQQEDLQNVIGRVNQLAVVPQNETPNVATVTDPEALRSQPFFANAKRGDRVLIYPSARRVILYDPVQDKIIEMAPLGSIEQLGGTQPSSTPSFNTTTTLGSASSTPSTPTSTSKTKPKP